MNKTSRDLPFCECGCGKRVNKLRSRFISGHNMRGKHFSEETRQKMSEIRIKKKFVQR